MRKLYQEFTNCNILGVTLEHNGIKGGDAGHGGFVSITIEDLAGTYMEVNDNEADKVKITLKGDAERETLLEALKMIVTELEQNKTL
jgi:hypothetical protein